MDEQAIGTAGLALPDQRPPGPDETALLDRLRVGDEAAFTDVVDRWSRTMLRVARAYVSTDASAQEVVQDTWLAVIRGLDAFEGRSTLKTWAFRILVNTAKTRGVREARSRPMSSLVVNLDDDSATVDPSRFRGPDDQYPGGWAPHAVPQRWEGDPAREVLRGEVRTLVSSAMSELPERQRAVLLLRDVQGCDSDEVCQILDLTPENQRVLLHRGRARMRASLEDYYRRGDA
jgi:RNA polymerase sigma-70 factor, ECF subfamily